jgi:tetratricopeptide (TPR) repeat protein
MSVPNVEETISVPSKPLKRIRPRRWPWILAGILALFGLTAGGSYLGYQEAIRQRLIVQSSQLTMIATEQYQLGLADLTAKNYSQARDRFEYVIRLDPKFPGVQDKLGEALMHLSITATPTLAATPTVTPTPDTRGEDQLFSQVKTDLANKEWDKAILTLDSLRSADAQYHAVEVDGMYYIALRNRGADKILKQAQLQEGMYDLSLAERFGPLDSEAYSYRYWANQYLTGAAYWKVDWPKVVEVFSQVAANYPGLRDSGGVTASERLRLAQIGLGDKLMTDSKPCDAAKAYQAALDMSQDGTVEQKHSSAEKACKGPEQPTAEPTTEANAEPTIAPTTPPVEEQPTAVPTEVPPAQAPTETTVPPEPTAVSAPPSSSNPVP